MKLEPRKLGMALSVAAALAFSASACKPANETTAKDGGAAATSVGGEGGTRPTPTAKGNEVSGDTIKIGIVASQTGAQAPWGLDSVRGAQLAVNQVNDAGGIGGKKVELLIGDSQSKPESGKSAAEDLITKGAVGLLGEVASGTTLLVAKSAFDKGVPLIAIGATKEEVTKEGSNIFRVCYTDDFQGPVMALFAYKELGLRNVALMTDLQQPYSVGLSKNFKKKFEELGGKIVDEQTYQSGQAQYNAQLTNLKAKNPDGLFLSGYFTEVGPIARAAKEVGLNAKLMGGDGWDSKELINLGGEAIVGGYFCNHYNSKEPQAEVVAFLERWRKAYGGEPGTTMGALGYDAAGVMLEALKAATPLNSAGVTEAISQIEDFPGVSGAITLKGKNGDPPKRALVVEVTPTGFEFRKSYEHAEVMSPSTPAP